MNTDDRKKLIFFIILGFLFLHAAYGIGTKSTIFPSLIFPGFSTSAKFVDKVELNALNMYAIENKNTFVLLDKDEFFSNIYYKYVNFLTKSIILHESGGPKKAASASAKKSFQEYAVKQLKQLYPNKKFDGILIVEGKKIYDIASNSADANIIDKHETYVWFTNDTQ
ncbi:MAG: hypothetical protein EOP47_15205 [Sphingobacteriaceae bacterium]|nr:MAG: hypothetical protein EOP47_15205 [Sphingobacteriaceae bacterium]